MLLSILEEFSLRMVILPVERAAFRDFLQYFAPALDKHVSYIVSVDEAWVLSLT